MSLIERDLFPVRENNGVVCYIRFPEVMRESVCLNTDGQDGLPSFLVQPNAIPVIGEIEIEYIHRIIRRGIDNPHTPLVFTLTQKIFMERSGFLVVLDPDNHIRIFFGAHP